MAVRLLLGIAVAALASCSSEGRDAPTSTVSSTSINGKVTPPVDVSLVILGDDQEIGKPFHMMLTFVTHEGTNAVRASVRGSGVVTVIESGAIHSTQPAANRQMAVDAMVRIDGVGSGQISGTVDVVNDKDGVQSAARIPYPSWPQPRKSSRGGVASSNSDSTTWSTNGHWASSARPTTSANGTRSWAGVRQRGHSVHTEAPSAKNSEAWARE